MYKFSLLIIGLAVFSFFSCTQTDQNQDDQAMSQSVETSSQRMLRHVVLFKFKETSSAESIDSIENAFRELPKKIKEIKDFEWGTDVSVENLSQGFTHCFFVSFADEAGREVYLPHPDHQAFVNLASPHIDKVLVVDYFSKD